MKSTLAFCLSAEARAQSPYEADRSLAADGGSWTASGFAFRDGDSKRGQPD